MVRPIMRPAITEIRFKSIVPGRGDPLDTVFVIGDGPCGKTVRSLSMSDSLDWVHIEQVTTDGSTKRSPTRQLTSVAAS